MQKNAGNARYGSLPFSTHIWSERCVEIIFAATGAGIRHERCDRRTRRISEWLQ